MRSSRHLIALCCLVVSAFPAVALAAEGDASLPAGIFRMADGTYYQPSTGLHAPTLQELAPGTPAATSSTSTPPTTSTSEEPPYVLPTPLDPFPLKSAIRRGRDLLQAAVDADTPAKPRTSTVEPDDRHITLAIWDPATDDIRTWSGMKRGTKLVPDKGQADDVRVSSSNGINSEFRAKGGIVVAIRYPIYAETAASTKKHKRYEVQDEVYTPFSADLRTPEMIAYGKAWLAQQVTNVFDMLRLHGVPSRSMPTKRVADVIDPELTELIMAIEHIDQGVNGQRAKSSLERFYVTVAANEGDAYDFSRSKVGALGIAQFMPKTYAFVSSFPGLGLNKDFVTAMRTPAHAITAEVAYLDYLLAQLPKGTAAQLADHPDLVHEYIAASYNGGSARVKKAMAAWEENLDAKERLHVLSRSRLKLETMHYVLKLRQVRDILRKDGQIAAAI